jgi:S-DNA-T family DNA segregation ATPase FtsK/SpoIIIE
MAKKQSKRKKIPLHPDTQALFFLSLAPLLFLALFSFHYQMPQENFLGRAGYFFALGFEYFFGLAAYLIPAYLFLFAIRLFNRKRLIYTPYDHIYFFILLASCCILLTVAAEHCPSYMKMWKEKIISETVSLSIPFPKTFTRYNLGGIPAYFLFVDLPHLNLQNILSPAGTVLIFSSLGFLSFILLTQIPVALYAKRFWQGNKILGVHVTKQILLLWKRYSASPALKAARIEPPAKMTYSGLSSSGVKINLPEEKKGTLLEPKKKIDEMLNTEKPKVKIFEPPKKDPMPGSHKKETIAIPTQRLTVHIDSKFQLPSPDLLSHPAQKIDQPTLKKDLMRQATILEETLKSFGIEAKVGEINSGPTITSFEVHPSIGVKVQKIKALENDIALNMEAKSIRIVAPIPGKAAVGVEVPAIHPQEVNFKEMLLHYQQKTRRLQVPILLGKAVNGDWIFSDLAKMPHLLIAGATGSGKSVCINTIVMSLLMNARPEEIKLLMIDPKKVELTQYSRLPHMIAPVITEPHGAYAALQWLVKEMQVRYEILKQLGLRNISAFNGRKVNDELEKSLHIPIPEQMPTIVAIVDEFADLMMVSSADLETPIARIAQMARAVGIHLILATQRPSREVITGIIKANIPTRISFKVASRINSQIILDETGAESLLGNGDCLFLAPGTSQLMRAQGAYIGDEDINQVIQYLMRQAEPHYLIPSFDSFRPLENSLENEAPQGKDPLYDQALSIVLSSKSASTTYLQRKLKIGYARAASLMDELEENGVISAQDGAKPRRVIAASQLASLEEDIDEGT